jgi:hypothetical protein
LWKREGGRERGREGGRKGGREGGREIRKRGWNRWKRGAKERSGTHHSVSGVGAPIHGANDDTDFFLKVPMQGEVEEVTEGGGADLCVGDLRREGGREGRREGGRGEDGGKHGARH